MARSFVEANEAEETYIVVHGQLEFDRSALPPGMLDDPEAQGRDIPARITGAGLMRDGFTLPFATDLTLRTTCAGPWCATAEPGEALTFLEKTDDGYVLTVSPCGGHLFQSPTTEDLSRVSSCFAGGACDPS